MKPKNNKIYRINLENAVWGTINKKTFLIIIPKASSLSNYDLLCCLETQVFELKGFALEIWRMLLDHYDSEKILKHLIKKYGFSKKQIRIEFIRLIKQLKKRGIIYEMH